MTGAGELAMFLAIGAASVGLLFGPIGSAIARRLGGRAEPGDATAQIEEVRDGMAAEVEHLRSRLVEVEERLDFAERLLASNEASHHLPGREHR